MGIASFGKESQGHWQGGNGKVLQQVLQTGHSGEPASEVISWRVLGPIIGNYKGRWQEVHAHRTAERAVMYTCTTVQKHPRSMCFF